MMNRESIGMPTLVEMDSLGANVTLALELGLGFVEVNQDIPEFSDIASLRTLIDHSPAEVSFTIHLPEATDFLSFVKMYREASVGFLEEIANRLPAGRVRKINTHLSAGVYFNLPDRRLYINREHAYRYFEVLNETFSRISGLLDSTGHQLNIENSGLGRIPGIAETIARILRFDRIRLTRDVGHEAKVGYADTEYLTLHKDKVDHYHIHDFNGERDHQELFTGTLPLQQVFADVVHDNCTCVIEVKAEAELRNSVRKLRERGLVEGLQ